MDHVYAPGDTVGAKGQIYTCKEFPYDGKLPRNDEHLFLILDTHVVMLTYSMSTS